MIPPLILGMMVRNEEEMLRMTLPVLRGFPFSARIALDTGSVDRSIDVLQEFGFSVTQFKWNNDFSAGRNQLMAIAADISPNGFLLMLDADEAMTETDVMGLRGDCCGHDLITFPRINLAARATLQEIGSYPDKQGRCVRLSSDVGFRGRVHELPFYQYDNKSILVRGLDKFLDWSPIYHFGWCKPPHQNWLRSHNYVQIANGKETISDAPDWAKTMSDVEFIDEMKKRHTFAPFTGWHPLKEHYA